MCALLSVDELKTLITQSKRPCVSIYLPTHRAGAEIQQGPIRLKNLLRQAEEQLAANGVRKTDSETLLGPGRRLLEDTIFWQHQSDGLALFLSGEVDRMYRLPLSFEEFVAVDDRYHFKPLLPLLTGDGRFYILAVSQNKVRLFEGTRHRVSELDLRDVPRSLADALGHDWEERSLQFHTGSSGDSGGRSAFFHGHGVGAEDGKEELGRYLQLVDHGIRELLKDREAPLVLAAVDYLIPIYRAVSRYPHLLEQGLEGNPDDASPQQLHRGAWALVEPSFMAAQEEAAARYRRLAGTGRATSDLREIVPAAHDGRVDTLFVALGVELWGRFDVNKRTVELDEGPANGNRDLLDYAAIHSLLNGGKVFAVEAGQVPSRRMAAAIFRY